MIKLVKKLIDILITEQTYSSTSESFTLMGQVKGQEEVFK